MKRYRFFDLCVSSELELPPLPASRAASVDWHIVRAPQNPDESGMVDFHHWQSPDEQILMSAARCGQVYLLDVLGLAKFRIDFETRRIEVHPMDDCAGHTLAHLLLDQVLPRAVCHDGNLVIHASAVLLESGRAVAFAGQSGRGKSTLATAFHQQGHSLISDDCLLLKASEKSLQVIPAYPSLRLWPDSVGAMFDATTDDKTAFSTMAHYTQKQQAVIESGTWFTTGQWPLLDALFLLDEPVDEPVDGSSRERIHIQRAGGSTTLMTIIESMFALDVVDKETVRRDFEMVGQLAGLIPVYRLSYWRDYSLLSRVTNEIKLFRHSE
jgi:hypothetical protein